MDSRLDVAASYPIGELCFNIGKATTKRELIRVEGVDETTMRMMTINFSGGASNAVEICTKLFNMPPMDEMLDAFMEEECDAIEGTVISQENDMLIREAA